DVCGSPKDRAGWQATLGRGPRGRVDKRRIFRRAAWSAGLFGADVRGPSEGIVVDAVAHSTRSCRRDTRRFLRFRSHGEVLRGLASETLVYPRQVEPARRRDSIGQAVDGDSRRIQSPPPRWTAKATGRPGAEGEMSA